ncbi:helix-turn-helix transcriptional regulator [Agilicoccus flavus]|uniref:helix-turn-helix transcriptional regulator n=1 Tax=Agilicoccus flavus TaxID=2775968 RepID=UPI0027DA50F3|nr:crosslink repair DNA glycosylase YcaQ family protein [Agilicoccus flavus]
MIFDGDVMGGPVTGVPGAVGAPADAPVHDARTRDRVLAYVSEYGPVTAATLAELLDLTPTAVRRHLEHLVEVGDIAAGEGPVGPRGRGRPARFFVVTEHGHRRLESDYAGVALAALRFLSDHAGPEAVDAFARERFAGLERRYVEVVDAAGPDLRARVEALAAALAADGFAASARSVRGPGAGMDPAHGGVQLCQGHCPVQRVAAEFPQFCEAETDAFARLLGVHVQRLATLAGGEHVCTTFVPDLGTRPHDARPGPGPAAAREGPPRPDPSTHGAAAVSREHDQHRSKERTPR